MSTGRHGGVLLLVLLALGLLGATGAAVLAAAQFLRDDARAMLASLEARSLAAASIGRAWEEWDGAARAGDPDGALAEWLASTPGAVATVQRARLHPQLWWIAADARAVHTLRQAPVRHASAVALHLAVRPDVPLAALSTGGTVLIGAGASIDGGDVAPVGWPCVAESMLAVALHRGGGSLLIAASGSVVGDDRRFMGGAGDDPRVPWSSALPVLRAAATVRLASGAALAPDPRSAGGRCPPLPNNWGEPERGATGVAECRRRWVVVHAAGALTLTGGRGQGVLIADGALRLTGSATFVGLIIARHDVRLEDRARLLGALVILADSGRVAPTVTLTGASGVQRSHCAVLAALLGGPLLAPAEPGGWITLW